MSSSPSSLTVLKKEMQDHGLGELLMVLTLKKNLSMFGSAMSAGRFYFALNSIKITSKFFLVTPWPMNREQLIEG